MYSLEELHSDDILTEEVVDVSHEQPPVPVIRHVTSVVDASNEVLKGIPWSLIISHQVNAQQILRYLYQRTTVYALFMHYCIRHKMMAQYMLKQAY